MLTVGPIAFLQPWLLLGLIALPLIWLLLRAVPPAPRRITFPALRLLRDLDAREETPARTPWWLLLLRLALAALIVIAAAQPVLHASDRGAGTGPLVLVVDNGWSAGVGWSERVSAADALLTTAERQGRAVVLLATAPPADGPIVASLGDAADARAALADLAPRPWPVDHAAALAALESAGLDPAVPVQAVWLTDGVESSDRRLLADALDRAGGLRLLVPPEGSDANQAVLLRAAEPIEAGIAFDVARASTDTTADLTLRLEDGAGAILAREPIAMPAEAAAARVAFRLPPTVINRASLARVEEIGGAGGVYLLDPGSARRRVLVLTSGDAPDTQPLLADSYYLLRALEPFATIDTGGLAALGEDAGQAPADIVILPDETPLTENDRERLAAFIEAGGMIIRFAGPLLAAGNDGLVPSPLRPGDRVLSGSMSWTTPQGLRPFPDDSPFAGLPVPSDVTVSRQVLADPSRLGDARVWATLEDGTPLVTASSRGGGWLVLVHTSAGPEWSDLALSGLYVDMLRRLMLTSAGEHRPAPGSTLPPHLTVDGHGAIGLAGPLTRPLTIPPDGAARVDPEHPPGLYGAEGGRVALNLASAVPALEPAGRWPFGTEIDTWRTSAEQPLLPHLIALAIALAVADMVVVMFLSGTLPGWRHRRGAATAALVVGVAVTLAGLASAPLGAQDTPLAVDERAIEAANGLYFAYVMTGDPEIDAISESGLESLSQFLAQRTAVEPSGAMGVDLERDELAFYPVLYWPITASQPGLSSDAAERVNNFMANGGLVLIDTRDAGLGDANNANLRRLTEDVAIPPLTPVPPDHVLTRAFYLLATFPGRYAGDEVWVVDADETVNDGVSPVVIGANDWAAAWAQDADGGASFPVVPGGNRQRDYAFRFGVNLVMYALTGNYKADQVHVPAILERLGQ
ncbi:MAG: DUF4159 domain-containing protein [Azospirillaceae bacterium]